MKAAAARGFWPAAVVVALLALACAKVLDVLIALAFVQSRATETAVFPCAVLRPVTRILALAPLIIIWVQDATASWAVCATLVALFSMIAKTTPGLRSLR